LCSHSRSDFDQFLGVIENEKAQKWIVLEEWIVLEKRLSIVIRKLRFQNETEVCQCQSQIILNTNVTLRNKIFHFRSSDAFVLQQWNQKLRVEHLNFYVLQGDSWISLGVNTRNVSQPSILFE
jgi:hypothetical protein